MKSEEDRLVDRLVSRLSRWHLALAAGLALAAVLVGVSLMAGRPSATITLSAAPGGHISPEGIQQVSVGTDLTITAWDDDSEMAAWLLVGARGVSPAGGSDGRYTYTLHVTGDTAVQASFVALADNVRPLPVGFGSSVVSVSPAQDRVVLSGDSDFVTDLAVGDIVANESGSGYDGRLMVRVRAIVHDGDRIVLTTEPVPFTAAIVKASIRALIPLNFQTNTSGEPVSLLGPPVALAADPAAAGLSLDLAHTFSTGGNETGGTARVEGHANLDLALMVNIDVAPRFGWPPGEVKLLEVALVESATTSASLDAETHARLAQAVELVSRDFPGTLISVFYVEPKLKLGLGTDISGNASLNVSASASQQLKVGIRFGDGRWSPINEFHTSATGSADVGSSIIARVFPTVRLGATIDFACTPYVEIQPGFVELTADINASPWWKLDAGLSGTAGIECDLLVTKLHYSLGDHELARVQVATADRAWPTPKLPSAPTATPSPTSPPPTSPTPTAPAAPPVRDLGAVPGGADSLASGISGTTVVGWSGSANGASRAFAYDLVTSTMRDLGTLPGYTDSAATGISGTTVVGWSSDGVSTSHAFVYDLATSTMRDLGTLPGDTHSEAFGISGSTVVGHSFALVGGSYHAFAYDLATSTMRDLGTLPGGTDSGATGISGSMVVGWSNSADGTEDAFAFDLATSTLRDLGTLPGDTGSRAEGISGSTVVGSSSSADGIHRAFAYDLATSTMRDLGAEPGGQFTGAYAISGSTVVGESIIIGGFHHAFAYDLATSTMRDLSALPDDPGSGVFGISGSTVVGRLFTADGTPRAFALTLP